MCEISLCHTQFYAGVWHMDHVPNSSIELGLCCNYVRHVIITFIFYVRHAIDQTACMPYGRMASGL